MTRTATLLVIVGTGAAACTARGVVGITASKSVDRDASTTDAQTSSDARALPDAKSPGVVAIDDCLPANGASLAPSIAQQLVDTSGDVTGMRYLYPYDGTVYPQGIPGPVLMWDGPASDVVYVRLHSSNFDYQGCLKPTAPNRLELPSGIWALAAQSTHGSEDPFTLDIKLLAGEVVHGPISEQLVIAAGSLPGSVYYMTTASPASVAGILRVRAGRPAEPFLTPPSCAGCHSVSANGTRFLAFSSGVDNSFALSGSTGPAAVGTLAPGADLAAVYPDGSLYVASAHPTGGAGPRSYGGGVMQAGLYDAATGTLIDDSGVPAGAVMPSFSPDGAELGFTDFGPSQGHTLALMSFDVQKRTASGYRSLYSSTTQFLGWPSFLPDGRALVFAQGDTADFSGANGGLIPVIRGSQTDLFMVDTQTQTATLLLQLVGFKSAIDQEGGNTYLPGGAADLHQDYYPAVAPAASGGYAWVLFDSLRTYGNQGVPRAIWVAALSVSADGVYRDDPSHPAFYLPGQNPLTPNFRAIAAPDP